MTARLQIEELSARYVQRTILRGVGLNVAPGEVIALLGPNGAGKSTVLRSIFGLATVTAGRVLLDGADVTGQPPRAMLERGVVYLPQGGQVFGPLTVRENLRLAVSLLPGCDPSRIDEVLADFADLRGRLAERAGALSGGQRQQLALACALLARPRLMLVDEPTIGLAAPLARRALELVAETAARLEAGVLLVEQNVNLALRYCAGAVLLINGASVATARAADLASDRALREQFVLGLEAPATAAAGT